VWVWIYGERRDTSEEKQKGREGGTVTRVNLGGKWLKIKRDQRVPEGGGSGRSGEMKERIRGTERLSETVGGKSDVGTPRGEMR